MYTPTEFSTAQDKKKFYNQFVRFVESNFDRKQFPKWFYTRLSMCFGHIAHYNIEGFYNHYFERGDNGKKFIQDTLRFPCYGKPEFTFCDVEKDIQTWLKKYRE